MASTHTIPIYHTNFLNAFQFFPFLSFQTAINLNINSLKFENFTDFTMLVPFLTFISFHDHVLKLSNITNLLSKHSWWSVECISVFCSSDGAHLQRSIILWWCSYFSVFKEMRINLSEECSRKPKKTDRCELLQEVEAEKFLSDGPFGWCLRLVLPLIMRDRALHACYKL